MCRLCLCELIIKPLGLSVPCCCTVLLLYCSTAVLLLCCCVCQAGLGGGGSALDVKRIVSTDKHIVKVGSSSSTAAKPTTPVMC